MKITIILINLKKKSKRAAIVSTCAQYRLKYKELVFITFTTLLTQLAIDTIPRNSLTVDKIGSIR